MNVTRFAILGLVSCVWMGAAQAAADPCAQFKWDVSHEVALHRSTPSAATVGTDVAGAPSIAVGTLYGLTLKPQESVRYAAPPTKKMLADGAHGGVLKLRVAEAGRYRVAIDSGFWLDVVAAGKPLESVDFNGSSECASPRKIVVYELPANADLVLQIAASSTAQAKLTVTRVTAAR